MTEIYDWLVKKSGWTAIDGSSPGVFENKDLGRSIVARWVCERGTLEPNEYAPVRDMDRWQLWAELYDFYRGSQKASIKTLLKRLSAPEPFSDDLAMQFAREIVEGVRAGYPEVIFPFAPPRTQIFMYVWKRGWGSANEDLNRNWWP